MKNKKEEEEEKEVPVADIIMFIALIVCEKTNFEWVLELLMRLTSAHVEQVIS